MKTFKPIILLALLSCAQVAVCQEKYSKIKIKLPATIAERKAVIALMDADHFNAVDDGIIVEIGESAQNKTKSVRLPV